MKKYIKRSIYLWIVLLSLGYSAVAQTMQLTGQIKYKNGDPISNALVRVKQHPMTSVYTDSEGKFSISGQIGEDLQVNTIDNLFRSVKIAYKNIDVTLDNNDQLVSYGSMLDIRKDELTSSIGYVTAKDLTNNSVVNPLKALYGAIPGLAVMQNGNFYIRGMESYGNNILVLVDGFERPISSLSLDEIESVSVLKDAASLAMYGMRGANGVLLITTKKGFGEKLSVNAKYEHGITYPFRTPKMLDAYGYATSLNQALINDGLDPRYSQAELDRFRDGSMPDLYPNVDWFKESLKDNGSTNKLNISVQQQAAGIRYYATVNYDNEEGLLKETETNDGYSTQTKGYRLNYRTNVDIDLTKNTLLSAKLSGNFIETNSPAAGVGSIMNAIYNTPAAAFPIRTENSADGVNNNWGGTSTWDVNPIAQISATGYNTIGQRDLYTDFTLQQGLDKIVKGLSAEATFSYGRSSVYADLRQQSYQYEQIVPNLDPATGEVLSTSSTLFGAKTPLSFAKDVLNADWSATLQGKVKYASQWADNDIKAFILAQRYETLGLGKDNTHRNVNLGGNAQYAKAGKYFVNATLMYAATNYLPQGSRGGLFPAIGLAWKVSKEDFMSGISAVDNLKVRASWGITGNDDIERNLQLSPWVGNGSFVTGSGTSFKANYGNIEGRPAASPYTYEKSQKLNFGFDASLFNKIDLTADAFYNRRTDIIVSTDGSTSGVLGVSSPFGAVGINTNKGIELGLVFNDNIGDFTYHVGAQFSYVKNKVVDMSESYKPYDYLKQTGRSIGQSWGLEAIGFFKDDADIAASPEQLFSVVRPGDIKYKDQNDDDKIDEYDVVPVGDNRIVPEIYYSGTIGAEYKGIGFNAVFQGVGNYSTYLGASSVFVPLVGNNNISTYTANSWTPATKETATLPRLTTLSNDNNYRSNNLWITSASFLKLRSVEVYYNIPEAAISKIGLKKLKVYARGTDLFSVDKIDYLDPESVWNGYPKLSSVNFGLQLGF